ncbi:MAG: hypothetical protein HC888_19360, partial [Candidatus Competibacteraceae bacterium]|nr:hypothetical protein [Candidatus Competibacteraceae bacterium]
MDRFRLVKRLERIPQRSMTQRCAIHASADGGEKSVDPLPERFVARDGMKPNQGFGIKTIGVRHRVVMDRRKTQRDFAIAARGHRENGTLFSVIPCCENIEPAPRIGQITRALARIGCSLEEGDGGAGHGRIIQRKSLIEGAAAPIGMQEPVAFTHRFADETIGRRRKIAPWRLIEDDAGARKRRDHQPIPVGKDLVVLPRPQPPIARLPQLAEQRLIVLRVVRWRRMQLGETIGDRAPLEIAALRDVVAGNDALGIGIAQHLEDLARRPGIKIPFAIGRIGIERRRESAAVDLHLACCPIHDARRRIAIKRRRLRMMGERIKLEQLRIVVEHLFKMRHEPAFIDAVA